MEQESRPAPRTPLELYQELKRNALGEQFDPMRFLDDLSALDRTGAVRSTPSLQKTLAMAGQDPLLRTAALARLGESYWAGNKKELKSNRRLAEILGIKASAAYLPKKRDLKTKVALVFGAGLVTAASVVGSAGPAFLPPVKPKESATTGQTNSKEEPTPVPSGTGPTPPATPTARVSFTPPLPTETPKPKLPEKPVSFANELLKPLINQAYQERAKRAQNDPEYLRRVDQELSENTLNFVVWVYWEEHGESYEDFGGAPTIFSYDLRTRQVRSVSLSRDIRTPNIESSSSPEQRHPRYMRHVYGEGGFKKVREVVEQATGLAVDYQMVVRDTFFKDLVEQVTGPLEVSVPKEHQTQSFRSGGQEYGPGPIPAGIQTMDATAVMRLILAEDVNPNGKEDERSYRKTLLFKPLINKLQEKIKTNPFMIKNFYDFFTNQIRQRNITLDFNLNILDQVLGGILNAVGGFLFHQGEMDFTLPQADPQKVVVVHDPYWGDGGVNRAHNIRDDPRIATGQNEAIRREINTGKIPDHMLIPNGGDPYATDLVKGYWQAVRQLVRQMLR